MANQPSPRRVKQSTLGKAIDFAVHIGQKAGVNIISLAPEKMIAHAERRVPGEKVDDVARERLEIICRSYDNDAALSANGRGAARFQITAALIARLRLRKMQREKPEIFETPLNRPIIVTGLPRSGTTFMQRILAEPAGSRSFAAWELTQPIPPEHDVDGRREFYAKAIERYRKRHPDVDSVHRVGVDEPEECTCLRDSSLISPTFGHVGPCVEYMAWYEEQDQSESYAAYRAMLQIKQHEDPDKRLVLKGPAHMIEIDALASAVPEACLVQTHRDPLSVVASVHSLFLMMYGGTTMLAYAGGEGMDPQVSVDRTEAMIQANEKARVGIEHRIYDVLYPDLTADPVTVVENIYRYFDLPWTDEVRNAVAAYAKARPRNKHGRHRYSLEEFGLAKQDLIEQFADYRERWGFADKSEIRKPVSA